MTIHLFSIHKRLKHTHTKHKKVKSVEPYFIILSRTIFLYVLILVVFRLMGKREVGELGLSDIVVYVIIAEVATFALDDPDKPLMMAIFPILILLVIQYTNARIVLKNKKLRDFIDGDPSLMIANGKIMELEMRKQRYNLDDLLQQLREQGISSVKQVKYAFLEQSGKLSVFLLDDENYSLPLILDGFIDYRHLRLMNQTEEWLKAKLVEEGYDQIDAIFYCSYENGRLHVQLKTL